MVTDSGRAHRPPLLRVGAASVASTVQGALPAFLVGALAVQIGRDIGLGATSLGIAVTVFFVVATLGSFPAGWLVERIGARKALLLTGFVSCLALALIGTATRNWWQLALGLAVGGVANAFAQPAANLLIFEQTPARNHGTLFGAKQAAVPGASVLAGAAVPLLGVTIGWRWAFVLAAAAAAIWPLALAPRAGTGEAGGSRRGPQPAFGGASDLRGLRLILLVSMLGAAVQTGQTVFLVPAAAERLLSPGAAGWLLAAASMAAVVTRCVVGAAADRMLSTFRVHHATTGLLVLSSLGSVVMAVSGLSPVMFTVGAFVSLGLGAGWNGLVVLEVIRRHADRPATASGLLQTGSYAGGIAGPIVFGAVADATAYGSQLWWSLALTAFLAAALLLIDERRAEVETR